MPRLTLAVVVFLVLVPAGAGSSVLPLEPCTLQGGIEARCGRFVVAEDRARPGGRTISLRIAVLPARDGGTQRDPIVHLAGGPGGSAVADAAGMSAVFFGLNESRDIVLVDQRGTGASNRLMCRPSRAPVATAIALKTYVRACLASLDADPRNYTTVPAMDDLADVLDALGYDEVNVCGVSYGATAAQYLLAQHDELVRTAILDGATLLDVPIFELLARNSERALRDPRAMCRRAPVRGCVPPRPP